MNPHDNTHAAQDFLKTRIESTGLPEEVSRLIQKNGIRTVGGIVGRSEQELRRMFSLSQTQAQAVVERLMALAGSSLVEPAMQNEKTITPNSEETGLATDVPSMNTEDSTIENVRTLFPLFETYGEDDIVNTLANNFGLSRKEIESPSRRKEIVRVRDIIVYLLRDHGGMSFPAIGKLLGNRDHTTVMHSYKKMSAQMVTHPEFKKELSRSIAAVVALKERKQMVEQQLLKNIASIAMERASKTLFAPEPKKIPERNLKVLELYREGLSLKNIGSVFNITRERVRQIVVGTIIQIARNESITRGIVMSSAVLVEEEKRKHMTLKQSKRDATKPPSAPKEYRWSRFYAACTECGTIAIPHVRKGLCEQCIGQFRGPRREEIITAHNNECDSCGKKRHEAIAEFKHDLFITKIRQVLCKKCFTDLTGKKLGSYKNFEWSRFHEKCKKCGTISVPHAMSGLCDNCSPILTSAARDRKISLRGSKCSQCGVARDSARSKYNRDLSIIKNGETLCAECFQKYARSSKLASKASKRSQAR